MAYVFADSGASVESRFFFPAGAILEDPATGPAAEPGGWFVSTRPGVAVERTVSRGGGAPALDSHLRCSTRSPVDGRIFVSGRVIELGRGAVSL
jgi:predicted PhzF superfamily epimerase YddE/YHI9